MSTETMNIIAVILGPIVAVIITLWYQNRKEKRDTKHRAFLLLMAHRRSSPPDFALVEVLNTLDVVFQDTPKITQLWHEYYDLLSSPNPNFQVQEHKYIDLVSEIASALGYSKLKQTDIDKFYRPQGHADQAALQNKIQKEFLRVLENTTALVVHPKEDK